MNAEQWRVVKEVFHAAIERPAAERLQFVVAASNGDHDVQAEVERLLAAHSESANFIESPPVSSTLTGRTIGRYEVGRLLGVGGMGEVYAARDVGLEREVAIKIATAASRDAQSGLRREAQHASRLNHPHICTIYEVGTFDGRSFIAMEYVGGDRLSDIIPNGGLPIDTVIQYGVQISDALAYAHGQRVSHRDLKSANIGVTPERRAKVLDFGLARRLPGNQLKELSQSTASLAGQNVVAGTLSCMAPEVLRGEPDDERSDIWGLGVLLYEMSTGARPFAGATPFQLSGAILHEPPTPMTSRVPAPLQSIILRCLQKDPHERYAKAAEVTKALEKSVGAPPLKPRRTVIAAAAAVLIALAFAAAWYGSHWWQTSAPAALGPSGRPAIAVMPFDTSGAGRDDQFAWMGAGVPSMLTTGLAQTQGLDVVGARRLQDAVKQLGAGELASLDKSQAADVARRAGAGAMVVGSIFWAGTNIRIDAQLEDLASGRVLVARSVRGTDVFALVDRLAAEIRDAAGLRSATDIRGVAEVSSGSLEAYRLYFEGVQAFEGARLEDARRLLGAAVRIDPEFAEAYLALAGVSHVDGHPNDHRDYLQRAKQHAERLGERDQLLLQVEVAREEGQAAEAARALDELLAKFPNYEVAYVSALWLYSSVTGIAQDTKKGLAIQAGGVRALPSSFPLRNSYAYMLIEAGQSAAAIEQLEVATKLAPREPNPYDSLGEAHLAAGMPQKAIEFYSRALTIDSTFTGSNIGRGIGLAILGRYDEALATSIPESTTNAFILSRVGRYREALRAIDGGTRQASAQGNEYAQANGRLLAAWISIERGQYVRASEDVATAIKILGPLPARRQRGYLVLAHMIGGIADARAGKRKSAKDHLDAQQAEISDDEVAVERVWVAALEGEIALAEKQLDEAAAIYTANKNVRAWVSVAVETPWMFGPNPPSRDGLARVAIARGDLAGAIQMYRRLTKSGGEEGSSGVLEPRYVLQLARLLDRAGDKAAARVEYGRFLDFWKNADADQPELAEAKAAVR